MSPKRIHICDLLPTNHTRTSGMAGAWGLVWGRWGIWGSSTILRDHRREMCFGVGDNYDFIGRGGEACRAPLTLDDVRI